VCATDGSFDGPGRACVLKSGRGDGGVDMCGEAERAVVWKKVLMRFLDADSFMNSALSLLGAE
jgi:hypothetical protein